MQLNPYAIAAHCHDIQVSLGNKQVPEFDTIPEVGMAVRLALHLRGLSLIKYSVLQLVASYYLNISGPVLKNILLMLAEVEFIDIYSTKTGIEAVLPKVPYFDDLYEGIGEYAKTEKSLNESEAFAIHIMDKLSSSPIFTTALYDDASKTIVNRSLQIGQEGGYVLQKKARGKDILLSPIFFSENPDVFADIVAKAGATNMQRILGNIKACQGWPLSLIEKTLEINGISLSADDVNLIKRLAQEGAIKPPSINTTYAGNNCFIFTPTPNNVRLTASKREVYERAMALVASVRQGQLLPQKYAIRSPLAILRKLRNAGYIGANTEAIEQYKKLTVLRVGRLENTGGNFCRFHLNNEAKENVEALDMAIDLISQGDTQGTEVDDDARIALLKDQTYIESIVSSQRLREQEHIQLSEEQQLEIDAMFLGGASNK